MELHTGAYANACLRGAGTGDAAAELARLERGAAAAKALGLRVNAGHGLDYRNVARVARIPMIEELNIGFAIVARSLFVGIERAVREMRAAMAGE